MTIKLTDKEFETLQGVIDCAFDKAENEEDIKAFDELFDLWDKIKANISIS